MSNELNSLDKMYLKIALDNQIEKNLEDLEYYSKKTEMKAVIEYLKDRIEMYKSLIIKLKDNGTV
jgi:hypothetical protein